MRGRGFLLISLIILAFALPSCGEPQTVEVTIPQTVEVTRVVPQTIEVTQIVPQTVIATKIVIITATPKPATPTTEPTPAPVYQKWTSTHVLEAFRAAGLEVGDARAITQDDFGISPNTVEEGTRFFVPSLGEGKGGRIFSYASQQNLEIMKAYYVTVGESNPLYVSWLFVKDNILVQINGNLPEEKARQYEAALNAIE